MDKKYRFAFLNFGFLVLCVFFIFYFHGRYNVLFFIGVFFGTYLIAVNDFLYYLISLIKDGKLKLFFSNRYIFLLKLILTVVYLLLGLAIWFIGWHFTLDWIYGSGIFFGGQVFNFGLSPIIKELYKIPVKIE